MNIPQTFWVVLFVIYLGFITWLMFQGKIMRQFNLVDKRQFLNNAMTFEKLNTLMAVGEVSLYSHEFMSEPNASVNFTKTASDGASVNKRFQEKDLSTAVENAYAWVVANGIVKE